MAARNPKQEDGGAVEARALVDLPEFGVLSGRLVTADSAQIAALVCSGKADDHPDAVAQAKALAE